MASSSKVAIVRDDRVDAAVTAALDLLDLPEDLFRGKNVAVKPNDTWASAGDLTACTQADSVDAVLACIGRCHPRSMTVSGGSGAAETDHVFSLLGIDRVIRRRGALFFDHNRPPFTRVELPYGPQKDVMVNPRVLEYETLVSLAQLKVHASATVTLTMKNIAMSYPAADYYGHPREELLHPHRIFEDLQGFIVGMIERFPISLGIILAHPAMVGTGPVGGTAVEAGLCIASTDCVAADAVGAAILGRRNVHHISEAARRGLGTCSLDAIEILGLPVRDARRILENRSREAYELAQK